MPPSVLVAFYCFWFCSFFYGGCIFLLVFFLCFNLFSFLFVCLFVFPPLIFSTFFLDVSSNNDVNGDGFIPLYIDDDDDDEEEEEEEDDNEGGWVDLTQLSSVINCGPAHLLQCPGWKSYWLTNCADAFQIKSPSTL